MNYKYFLTVLIQHGSPRLTPEGTIGNDTTTLALTYWLLTWSSLKVGLFWHFSSQIHYSYTTDIRSLAQRFKNKQIHFCLVYYLKIIHE